MPTGSTGQRALTLVCCLLLSTTSGAASNQQQLESVRGNISSLKSELGDARQKYNSLQDELKRLEKSIAKARSNLRRTKGKLKKQQKKQRSLNNEISTLTNSLAEHRRQLRYFLRHSYSSGRQQALKLLLSQDNPARLGRNMVYLKHLSKAQLDTVGKLNEDLAALEKKEQALRRTTDKLAALKDDQQRGKKALERDHKKRKTTLAKLNKNIDSKDRQLAVMQENEQRLLKLIEELQRKKRLTTTNLKELKGKLKWPAKGRIRHRFGSKKPNSHRKWQGVVLASAGGSEVKAVAAGKVIFSEWIRGYGLMLIIDHGNSYLSIYGHNESLYKENGDTVEQDEVIATVGTSGGQEQSGLYFALRHKSVPLNPAHWCR